MSHELRNSDGQLASSTNELNQAGADSIGLVGGGQTAWHKLGIALKPGMSAIEAGEALNMFWPVESWELMAMSPQAQSGLVTLKEVIDSDPETIRQALESYLAEIRPVDSYRANVRSDSKSILGVVSDNYAICQNRELAEFTDALAQTGQVEIETAGTIMGGKKLWFLARGEAFFVGGDKVFPYVLVSNAHDGSGAVRVTPTTVRPVCSNTLHMVIPRVEDMMAQPNSAAIVMRHSGQISDKLEKAKDALKHYGTVCKRNEELFNRLNDAKISEDMGVELFGNLYTQWYQVADQDMLDNPETARVAELRLRRMETGRDLFLSRWKEEKEATFSDDNAWGAMNAITGWMMHDKRPNRDDDTKARDALFGQDQNKVQQALAETMAMVAV
jgi:phage/plasmid-like protein (TIGR03299 family)